MIGYVVFDSLRLEALERLTPLVIAIPTGALIIVSLLSERFPALASKFNVSLADFVPASQLAVQDTSDNRNPIEDMPVTFARELRLASITLVWMVVFFSQ